ncbi:hypothetical protein MRX96_018430 [Rhipicephalus microplus]
MSNLRRVHRVRDQAVAGVNWRLTRFVDEVPSLRGCCLCRMIPKKTLVVPCGHLLCQSCLATSPRGSGGRCPLDREPFEEAKCGCYEFPMRAMNAFKAVLHKELAQHYEAGCSVAGSTARLEKTPSESRALTLGDVTAAFEEMKSLLNDSNNGELLAAIQSQVNGLAEQVRKQEYTLAEITHKVGESVKSRVAQVAASTSSATSQREDHFAGLPRDVLQGMQKTSSQDFPRHFIEMLFQIEMSRNFA